MKKVKQTLKQVHLLPKGVPLTDENIRAWTELLTRRFLEKRDPIVALQTFLYARQARIDVPEPILDWLTVRIQEYWERNGKKSLERIMGLSSSGRISPFISAMISERDEMLLMDVMKLKCHGVKLVSAVEMVLGRLEENADWNQTGWKLPAIGVKGLLQKYRRWADRDEFENEYRQEVMPKLGQKEIVAYYRKFPNYRDYLPDHQKILLNKYPRKA